MSPALFVLLAVASSPPAPCNDGTTYDIRMCWDKQSDAADATLQSVYAQVALSLRGLRAGPGQLAATQRAWLTARTKTCDFDYQLYLPGTIAPQLAVQCVVRMTRARTARLAALRRVLETERGRSIEVPASAKAQAELNRVIRLLAARITPSQRLALTEAQTAWAVYRDKACALERGACLTDLTHERIGELEASGIGEAFW